jgi:hypothetical protein
MANLKISDLTEIIFPQASDVLAIVNDGVTKKIQVSNLKQPIATPIFNAFSYVTQQPIGTDTPIQLTFGDAQDNAYASINELGLITVKQAGTYFVRLVLNFSRTGTNGGISLLNFRVLLNGVSATGGMGIVELDSSNITTPYSSSNIQTIIQGNTNSIIQVELVRDSASTGQGATDGGVISRVTNTIGWNDVPSCSISIVKIS